MRERVLVVDDEIGMRAALEASLRRTEWQVETAAGVAEGLRKFESGRHSLVITDMRMPDGDGLEVMRKVRQLAPETAVILLTAYGSIPQAVEAMKAGACDYLLKPVSYEYLHETVARLMTKSPAQKEQSQLLGNSPALLRTLEHARMAARTSADVLIEAESGTGKELLARYIHQHSRHAAGPFIAVNCAAVPETLLESELFGHARGAFTGAVATKKGKFELAHGGTLLLDEIGEMPLALQPKLLRVLQERKVERLGDAQSVAFATRVIATTNRNLSNLIHDNAFRADLYFRLNVIPLTLPPLRERPGDIALLARHFARAATDGGRVVELSPEFLDRLQEHTWPGNVRELANAVQRAITFSGGTSVLGPELLQLTPTDTECRFPPMHAGLTRRAVERHLFESTLAQMNGNRTRTAEALGVSLRTVRNKIRSYGLAQRALA